jgi:hypothetical protein
MSSRFRVCYMSMKSINKHGSSRNNWRRSWKLIFVITGLYFILVSNSFFTLIPEAMYDDGLQFRIAKNLTSGNWLGPYDATTLSKGITFPLWTATLHALDIPLWFGNALLYAAACLSFIFALRYVLKKRWLLISSYTVLLLNPMISPRVYRDTIAPALALFVLAWIIGIAITIIKIDKKWVLSSRDKRDIAIYSAMGLVGFPAWWFLREDSFWILPFIICVIMSILCYIFFKVKPIKYAIRQNVYIAAILFMPFLATMFVGLGIAWQNQRQYDRFIINDFTSHDFKAAYGSLTRIKDPNKDLMVPISYEMRLKAYNASPAFSELKTCLDNNGLGNCEYLKQIKVIDDYRGGWFFWALRQAVEEEGYYENASKAEDYYKRLSSEINEACSKQTLDCSNGERASLSPPFSQEQIRPTFNSFVRGTKYLFFLKDANNVRKDIPVKNNDPSLEDMSNYLNLRYDETELNFANRVKSNIRLFIAKIYQLLSPVVLTISIGMLLFVTFKSDPRKTYWREILLAWGLLMLILFRTLMLAFVDATSFPAISYFYYQSAYPLVFIFELLVIALIVHIVRSSKAEKNG